MLAYIGTGSQHPGCGFQLINQNSVIVFAAGEVNSFTSGDVQSLKMRSGDMNDIHPKNKQEVGRRLALLARADTYGERIVCSGPVYQTYRVKGDRVILSFECADGGLKTSDGKKMTGFAIAGIDGKYHWAEAEICGNEIIVSSEMVKHPLAVRYGWGDNPTCNLINGAGLPASSFQTLR